MSHLRFLLIPILISFYLSPAAKATASSYRIDPADMQQIMRVKDIKPGMKGYGKTVFRGTKVETFQAEVLGILKKANYGTDLIIVKLSGGPITDRQANLIEGMSGSPIYIDGKIIGAFAYGQVFGKEPIGMVTPIEYMLEAWDPSHGARPASFYPFSTAATAQPLMLDGRSYSRIAIDDGTESLDSYGADTLVFRPLATPVMASGLSPKLLAAIQEEMKPLNVRLLAGPGGPPPHPLTDVSIEPGAAVGISFVTGDVDLTGIGTVTYRRGNNILALGHPMFGIGSVDAMLTSAYVYDIFPSLLVSSKMAGPMKPIGRVYQDRPWSVAAEIGGEAQMIPCVVHMSDAVTGRKRDFRVNVINHPMLSALLIPLAAAEGILEMTGAPSDMTAKVKVLVEAEELGEIVRENTFFDSTSIEMAAISDLRQIMNMLRFNQFYPVSVKRVELWVDLESKHQTAKLERIFLKQGKFEPGDVVEINTVIKPFKGEAVTKTLNLELPRSLPNGTLTLTVSGGGARTTPGMMMLEDEMGGGPMLMIDPSEMPGASAPSAANLQQLINKFLERNRNDELVAKIVLPAPVPSIEGEKLSGLPPSIETAMKSAKTSAMATDRDEIKCALATDWVVTGTQRLRITVQKAEKREKAGAQRRPSGPPSSEPSMPEDESDETDEESVMLTPGGFTHRLGGSLSSPFSAVPAAATATVTSEEVDVSSEGEGEEAKESKPATAAAEKPVGRTPGVWRQTTMSEFLEGTLTNVSATTADSVLLAPSLKLLHESSDTYVWRLLPDGNGNVYAGTGNQGKVYRIAPDGASTLVYDSPELQIHSLAVDGDGNLYAGSSPNGIIYRIAPDGSASTFFDAEEKYILALAFDGKGNLYAATGDRCKVYRIAPNGNADVVLDASDRHALCLAVDASDTVYVGTGQNGIVYAIEPDGRVRVVYDASEDAITALALDGEGSLMVGTSPKGVIYRIREDAVPKTVYDKAGQGITDMVLHSDGNVYAVNATKVFRIMPDDTVCALEVEDDVQFLSLALSGDRAFAGTGNIGSIYTADVGNSTEGTYESPVHDCGLRSQWGVIQWNAELPEGTEISLRTRTGNVAEPDSTWSGWSSPYAVPGARIMSKPGRYVQYMASLKSAESPESPKLKDVTLVYLPQNQRPKVTLTSPKAGEYWAKKRTIKWTANDPDKDTLTYDVFSSTDGGKTWKPLGDKVESETATEDEPSMPEDEVEDSEVIEDEAADFDEAELEQAMADMIAELDSYPEIPQDVKDQMIEEAQAAIDEARASMSAESPASERTGQSESSQTNSTKQTSFSWDTSKYDDGVYLLKVVASDRLSNPTDPQTGEAISEPVVVTNKAPQLTAFKSSLTIEGDKRARIEGLAYHDFAAIAGVQYRVGSSSDWAAAAAADGIFDTSFETFVIITEPLASGENTLEIKAIDRAGNAATTKVPLKVD